MTDEWTALAEGAGNIFATREWLELWWKHFGRGGGLPCEEVREDGRLVALLPLYLWRDRPLRVARFAGHGAGDELGPLCLRGDEPQTADAVEGWLAQHDADLLVAQQLPADRGWSELLGGRRLEVEGNAVLRFADRDWEAFVATRSRNFRSVLRRAERRLPELPGFRVRLTDDRTRLAADLDTLFDLHRRRWAGRRTAFGAREPFHRDFAATAFDRGWLRLWIIELEGAAVAAWYGFRFGDAESYYQAGRDPVRDDVSVGLGLLAHTIRAAQADGMREYRFLRGDEEFKYRFTDVDPGLETLAVPRSRFAAAALSVVVGGRKLRQAVARPSPRSRRRDPRAAAARRGA